MKRPNRWIQLGIVLLALMMIAAVVAACGNDETTTTTAPSETTASSTESTSASTETTAAPSTETTAGTSTTVAGLGDYNGADKEFIAELPEPTVEPGKQFTVGFLLNNGAVGTLVAIENAAQAQVESMGGKL
jgi:ABC-type oligopeptide transport system substrate-binding subunit